MPRRARFTPPSFPVYRRSGEYARTRAYARANIASAAARASAYAVAQYAAMNNTTVAAMGAARVAAVGGPWAIGAAAGAAALSVAQSAILAYQNTWAYNPYFMFGGYGLAIREQAPLPEFITNWLAGSYIRQLNQYVYEQMLAITGMRMPYQTNIQSILGYGTYPQLGQLALQNALLFGTFASPQSLAGMVPYSSAIMMGTMGLGQQQAMSAVQSVDVLARLYALSGVYSPSRPALSMGEPVTFSTRIPEFRYSTTSPTGTQTGERIVTGTVTPSLPSSYLSALVVSLGRGELAPFVSMRQQVAARSAAQAIAVSSLDEASKEFFQRTLQNWEQTGFAGTPQEPKLRELLERYSQGLEQLGFGPKMEQILVQYESFRAIGGRPPRLVGALGNVFGNIQRLAVERMREEEKLREMSQRASNYGEAASEIERVRAERQSLEGALAATSLILPPLLSETLSGYVWPYQVREAPYLRQLGMIGQISPGMASRTAAGLARTAVGQIRLNAEDRREIRNISATAAEVLASAFGQGELSENERRRMADLITAQILVGTSLGRVAPYQNILFSAGRLGAMIGTMPMGFRGMGMAELHQAAGPMVDYMETYGGMVRSLRGVPFASEMAARAGLQAFFGDVLPVVRGIYSGSVRAAAIGYELEATKITSFLGAVPLGERPMTNAEAVRRATTIAEFMGRGYELQVQTAQEMIRAFEPVAQAAPNMPEVQQVMRNLRAELRRALDQQAAYQKWGREATIYQYYTATTAAQLVLPTAEASWLATRGAFLQTVYGGLPPQLLQAAERHWQIAGVTAQRRQYGLRAGVFQEGSAAELEFRQQEQMSRIAGIESVIGAFGDIEVPAPLRATEISLAHMQARARMFPAAWYPVGVVALSRAAIQRRRLDMMESQFDRILRERYQQLRTDYVSRFGYTEREAAQRAREDVEYMRLGMVSSLEQARTQYIQTLAPYLWEWAQAQPLLAAGQPARARNLMPSPEGFAEFVRTMYQIPTLSHGFTSPEISELARSMPYGFLRGFTNIPQNPLSWLGSGGGVVENYLKQMTEYLGRIAGAVESGAAGIEAPVTAFPSVRVKYLPDTSPADSR